MTPAMITMIALLWKSFWEYFNHVYASITVKEADNVTYPNTHTHTKKASIVFCSYKILITVRM